MNLADEYINARVRFGYWKDAAIRLTGECVWSFTSMFLELWDYILKIESDYTFYRATSMEKHRLQEKSMQMKKDSSSRIPILHWITKMSAKMYI